ncbi:MAG: hypothetical protein AAFU81_01610 [Pseudomonadota bacterium]
MTKRVRVNVSRQVLANEIRREERNGREVIVVPSTTMPDDITMNGIFYPADEIKNSFMTLNRTPAPFGHPEDGNGAFLSASDPEAINAYHVGAWNENVHQKKMDDGRFRVHVDKIIDVKFAEQTENGKALLNAIDKGEPIHTSTGLWANISKTNREDAEFEASDIQFDHDAILLHETGAATPDDGVGIFVNKDGEKQEIKVINSMLDAAEQELEWAARSALRVLEEQEKAPMIQRMISAMKEAAASVLREPTANSKESEMDKEQFDALSAKVDTLADNVETMQNSIPTNETLAEAIAGAISNQLKPITDDIEATKVANAAKEQEELDGYVETIVKANLLDEEAAKELNLNQAKKLAEKCKPGKADVVAKGFTNADEDDDDFAGYDFNANLKEAS